MVMCVMRDSKRLREKESPRTLTRALPSAFYICSEHHDCELLSPYAWPHDARASAAFSETMVRRHAQHWGSFPLLSTLLGQRRRWRSGRGEVR